MCRCMLRPEFAPPVDNVHCLKSQSISPAGIHAAFADGSVRFVEQCDATRLVGRRDAGRTAK